MMVIGLATADFESRHAVNDTDGGGTKKSESIRPRHQGPRPVRELLFLIKC